MFSQAANARAKLSKLDCKPYYLQRNVVHAKKWLHGDKFPHELAWWQPLLLHSFLNFFSEYDNHKAARPLAPPNPRQWVEHTCGRNTPCVSRILTQALSLSHT